MTSESMTMVFDALKAFGAVGIVLQLYLLLRNAKYDACHHLYVAFGTLAELTRFHPSVSEALRNAAATDAIANVLKNPHVVDNDRYRDGAESYANFFRYVFYNVDQKLIRSKDAAHIIGPWLVRYYLLGERIQSSASRLSEEVFANYFPAVPDSLRAQLARLTTFDGKGNAHDCGRRKGTPAREGLTATK